MSLGEIQVAQESHLAAAISRPGVIHRESLRGAWHGSQSVNLLSPVLHLQVFITKASTPQPSQTT